MDFVVLITHSRFILCGSDMKCCNMQIRAEALFAEDRRSAQRRLGPLRLPRQELVRPSLAQLYNHRHWYSRNARFYLDSVLFTFTFYLAKQLC